MTKAPITIIGGGLAALSATRALRKAGYDGDIFLATNEHHHPYERPPLSKDYLRGESDRSAAFTTPAEWFDEHQVDVRTGATVVDIDRAHNLLRFADGTQTDYSKILLATGSSPRPLNIPGSDLRGVHTLRTLEDADLLVAELLPGGFTGSLPRLVVIGDGWIGMEVAASARSLGLDVTVIGRGPVPLARVLGEEIGEVYAELHRLHGVRLIGSAHVARVVGEGGYVTGVQLTTGRRLPADVVVAGVGAAPNVGLAVAAGLRLRGTEWGGGVSVGGTLVTPDPSIFAAGDIASIPLARWRRPVRVEHWATALRTGAHSARAMLGATDHFDRLPYFYSDQFETSMEYAGFVAGRDAYDAVVISGSISTRSFAAFWLKRDRVEAGLTMNQPGRIHDVENLIRADHPISPDDLRDFISDSPAADSQTAA